MRIRVKGLYAAGGLPVAKSAIGLRVYVKDEAAIAALGCDKMHFMREAISRALDAEKLARSGALVEDIRDRV